MDGMIELVLNLITSETGGLAYRLVLVFSIAGALQLALALGRRNPPSAKRLAVGAGLLLALQLLLFLVAGLSWKGMVDAARVLPFLERAVSLISLVAIIWLWVFPKPSRTLDLAAFLVGFLGLLFTVFSGLSWLRGGEVNLGGSWNDFMLTAFSLVLLSMGIALLVLRKPLAWEVGLGMFLLLFLGYSLHLVWMERFPIYSATLRLAELAAYPMLLGLPLRLATAPSVQAIEVGAKLHRILRMLNTSDAASAWRAAASFLAHSGQADGCLLAGPPQPDGIIPIRAVYLVSSQQYLALSSLPEDHLPQLAEGIRSGARAQWTAGIEAQELERLANWLEMGKAEALLLLPLGDSLPGVSLILMRRATEGWSAAQVQQMAHEGRSLARFLHQMDQMSLMTPKPVPMPPTTQASARSSDFQPSPLDLGEALSRVLEQKSHSLRRKHIQIQMVLPNQLPLACVPEVDLLGILKALITRAEQMTPVKGTIELRAQPEEDPQGAPLLFIQILPGAEGSIKVEDGKSSDLEALRGQVEGLGGQVWESHSSDQATAISLLLPAWWGEILTKEQQEKEAG